jgi:hypothetical protein
MSFMVNSTGSLGMDWVMYSEDRTAKRDSDQLSGVAKNESFVGVSAFGVSVTFR